MIATVRLVRNDTTLGTLLAVFFDSRCSGLFNYRMTSRPICARLTRVRVAMGETVPRKQVVRGIQKDVGKEEAYTKVQPSHVMLGLLDLPS